MILIIRTVQQLKAAQSDVWIWGLAIAVMALALSIIVAQCIPWNTNRKDYLLRRICFIIIGLVAPFGFWLRNKCVVVPEISTNGLISKYQGVNNLALLICILAYFVVGIALMFFFKHSKFGSILGKLKRK